MNDRCMWPRRGGGICDALCEGRYCEHHARVAAVRDAGTELRAAREAVAKARDAVVDAAESWHEGRRRYLEWPVLTGALDRTVTTLVEAKRAESEARARLEALK